MWGKCATRRPCAALLLMHLCISALLGTPGTMQRRGQRAAWLAAHLRATAGTRADRAACSMLMCGKEGRPGCPPANAYLQGAHEDA